MGIKQKVYQSFLNVIKNGHLNLQHILYYAFVEGILSLIIPLSSAFIINSLVAHSHISVIVLGSLILFMYIFITLLRLAQEYIIEMFEERVFVEEGLNIANKAYRIKEKRASTKDPIDKLMNYFFDITTIQKVFPVFMLNGIGLLVQLFMSLILLFAFDSSLFIAGLAIILFYIAGLLFLGSNGVNYAIARSDMKHAAIYFLQQIPNCKESKEQMFIRFDDIMSSYVDARQNHFRVILRQLALSFMVQGIIISGFFMLGAYLVINGYMPVGEFVAAEIIIVSLVYSINAFVKQLDYVYDGIEGLYKVNKLSLSLEDDSNEQH